MRQQNSVFHVLGQVMLLAQIIHQAELGFQPVGMLFF